MNNDASIRLSAIQADLQQVERQIENLLSAIENMGFSPSLKEKLTKREAEKAHLKSQESHLRKLIVKIIDIPQVTNEMIEEWIVHLRDGLKNAELEAARRTLHQFVSKVVVKDGKGTIYYTFPVGSGDTKRLGLGKGDLDPRGRVPLTRHMLSFEISAALSTLSDQQNPDKTQLHSIILQMYANGMSYRQIGAALGIHWTRVGRIIKGQISQYSAL